MAQQEDMDILELQRQFATDDACREHLFKIRWPEGPTCAKCGGGNFYRINARNVYECRCGRQVSLTAGTIMHGSHTPLRKWFWAIYMAARDKRGVSASRLQKELRVSYPTAWLMLHKIRHGRGERDGLYLLSRIVETDETYVGGKKEGGKRGRGTEKTPVQVAVSLDSAGKIPGFVKMGVLEDVSGESIGAFVEKSMAQGSTVRTDGFGSYPAALGERYEHEPERFDPMGTLSI